MSTYEFTVTDIDGKRVSLNNVIGNKVALIVNVASKCGLTPQYSGLSTLYNDFESKGFVILGFPCNQFKGQEPGTNAEVKDFACGRGARFPLFSKVDVNGPSQDPLYSFLKKEQGGGEDIAWNFEKFLIDKHGKVVKRYGPRTEPAEARADIEKLLSE